MVSFVVLINLISFDFNECVSCHYNYRIIFVCLFELIHELVQARDSKFSMGLENGVFM